MQPSLTTDRLILRPFVPADAPVVQRLAGNPLIAAASTAIPHPYPDGLAEQWIATHAQSFDTMQSVVFAVTRKDDGELLGAISLLDITLEHQRAEMGYWINVDHWSQGYCTEAAKALMVFARDMIGTTRIVARCLARNRASAKVIEKCGLLLEGHLPKHVLKNNVFEDVLQYGIVYPQRREKTEPNGR